MSTDKEFIDDNFIFSEESESSEKIKNMKSEELSVDEETNLRKNESNKNVISVKRNRKPQSERAQTKLISVSAKNKKVYEILKNIRDSYASESDFICQAIIEKYDRDQIDKSTELKDTVKEILEEMVGENFIIMKSSSDIINVTNNNPIPPREEIVKEEPPKSNSNANADLIRGAMDMWDDE